EPLSALRRAHAVAITRADLAPPGRLDEVRARIRAVRADLPVLEVVEEPVGAADLAGKEVFAFCGIGNPDGFFRRLESLGARLSGRRAFDDHHAYTADELAALLRDAGSATPVTTQKDAVKLAGLPGAERVEVLKIRVAIRSGEEKLEALIESSLRECAPNSPNPPNSPKHREGRCCSGSTLSTRAPSSTFGVFGGFGEFGANSQVLST
ncbi:MAG TPA: tetraacyldisaccharide 4'-kinase, partial [Planctomycetota bacterium]|nr:tetraacyldisaccharide 4'-kinase [Planctomycetota bacterium]